MGKLRKRLEEQLKSEHTIDATDCIKIYDFLKEISDGKVWESDWRPLVKTIHEGYPKRRYKLTPIGEIVLKGINNEKL